jgi:endonuclease/exonuclease/phosphatase family metal-dependent hydrolase
MAHAAKTDAPRTRGIGPVLLLLGAAVAVLAAAGCAPPATGTRCSPVTVLTWNVENLFDDEADETDYPEYNPENGLWNGELYRVRLARTARVIRDSVRGGPDIVALQEVENIEVLNDLVESGLADQGYRHIVLHSSEGSPVNSGVLSRLPLLRTASYPVGEAGEAALTRDILEVSVDCSGIPLTLLVCHWKSRLGGAENTEPLRVAAAQVVGEIRDERLVVDDAAELLVLGALNENVDESQRIGGRYQTALENCEPFAPVRPGTLAVTTDRCAALSSGDRRLLYSPWGEAAACGDASGSRGSYWYDGVWETFDNFLLSPGLLDRSGLTCSDFWIVPHAYLRTPDGRPFGWRLESGEGYSDHLPLVLVLEHRPAGFSADP